MYRIERLSVERLKGTRLDFDTRLIFQNPAMQYLINYQLYNNN